MQGDIAEEAWFHSAGGVWKQEAAVAIGLARCAAAAVIPMWQPAMSRLQKKQLMTREEGQVWEGREWDREAEQKRLKGEAVAAAPSDVGTGSVRIQGERRCWPQYNSLQTTASYAMGRTISWPLAFPPSPAGRGLRFPLWFYQEKKDVSHKRGLAACGNGGGGEDSFLFPFRCESHPHPSIICLWFWAGSHRLYAGHFFPELDDVLRYLMLRSLWIKCHGSKELLGYPRSIKSGWKCKAYMAWTNAGLTVPADQQLHSKGTMHSSVRG